MFSSNRGNQTPAGTRRTSTPAAMAASQNGYQYSNNAANYTTNGGVYDGGSSTYKLYYFPIRNIAEASRMILTYAGVPFEDVRITMDEWPKWKPKMPQQTLPVLLVDGKRISQSAAIASFLGHRFGLAGRNDWEQARVDEAVHTYRDFYVKANDYMTFASGFKPGNVKEAYKALEPDAERYLSVFSHMLDRHNNQFIAGNRETYADFLIADFLFSLRGFAPKLFEKRPDIQQYIERVQSLPRLQNYLRNRPKTAI